MFKMYIKTLAGAHSVGLPKKASSIFVLMLSVLSCQIWMDIKGKKLKQIIKSNLKMDLQVSLS